MPPSFQAICEAFVKRSSIFSSVESIASYKALWPPTTVLRTFVQENVEKAFGHPYHMGLDISSKSTGVCVLSDQGNIVACHAIKPDSSCKGNSILSAAAIVRSIRETVASIDDNPTHWNITIEKYLQMFGASSFRTQGLFYLAEINGIVQYKLWENTGVAPASVHPSTARSTLSIKSAGNRDDTKDVVLAYAQKAVGSSIHWPRKKRSDGLADECFDMADAFVLARYGLIQDKVRSLLALASISPDLQSSIQHSTLFADFVKVHFAHHLRKYSQDDQTISLASLSPEFLEKQYSKLQDGLVDVVAQVIAPSD